MNEQSKFRIITISLFAIVAFLNFLYIVVEISGAFYNICRGHSVLIDYKYFEIIWIIIIHLLISISSIVIVCKFDSFAYESISKSAFRRFLIIEYVYAAYVILSFAMIAFSHLILLRAIELLSIGMAK